MDVKELLDKNRYDLADLREVFKCLRGEGGCPWDRVQTHESIRANLIEETYEVVESIDKSDLKLMREELGDLLLQVVFHAGIEEENGNFTLDDVISDVTDKLLRRHPHVFGEVVANDAEGALDAWEAAKGVEKTERKSAQDSMRAVPPALPALMRAQKISKKAMKDGTSISDLTSELPQLCRSLSETAKGEEESVALNAELVGRTLFAITALCEHNGIDTEHELNKISEKFIENYPKSKKC